MRHAGERDRPVRGGLPAWVLAPAGLLALMVSVVLNIHFSAPQTLAWAFHQQRAFKAMPCEIQSGRITDMDPPADLVVCYTYERDGITYTSHAYMPELPGVAVRRTRDKAMDILRAYPPHKRTFCYVSIHDPTRAVLIKNVGWRRLSTALALVSSMLIGPVLITRGLLRLVRPMGKRVEP